MYQTTSKLIFATLLMVPLAQWKDKASAEAKIGVVNVTKVFDDYVKSKTANKQLRVRRQKDQNYLNVLVKTLKDLQEGQTKLNEELLQEKLEEKRKGEVESELDQKRVQITVQSNLVRSHVRQANQRINKMANKVRADILATITAEVEKVGKEQKFVYIFDISGRSSTNVPPLLFQNCPNDLTEVVTKRLNDAAGKTTKATPPKKDEKK